MILFFFFLIQKSPYHATHIRHCPPSVLVPTPSSTALLLLPNIALDASVAGADQAIELDACELSPVGEDGVDACGADAVDFQRFGGIGSAVGGWGFGFVVLFSWMIPGFGMVVLVDGFVIVRGVWDGGRVVVVRMLMLGVGGWLEVELVGMVVVDVVVIVVIR